jgi:hypothetical protein
MHRRLRVTTPAITPLGKWSLEATNSMWYPGYEPDAVRVFNGDRCRVVPGGPGRTSVACITSGSGSTVWVAGIRILDMDVMFRV